MKKTKLKRIPKALVRSMYDAQHQRIQTGNRICAEIKVRLGQAPGESEKVLSTEAKKYLEDVREEFDRISDMFALDRPSNYLKIDYTKYKILSDAAMVLFAQIYFRQLGYESHMLKVIAKIVEQHPLWNAFLKGVKGCGPLMSSVILTEFDIHKAERISQFNAYAGLDVASDGRGRGRYKEHLTDQTYIDKDGKEQTKKGITFNPFLKTKLVGVLGSCFLKQSPDKCKYRKVYDDYKHRLEHHKIHSEKTKGHRHNMAIRYMIKMFLQDLWLAWRELENLPITKPYHEAVLGYKHHAT